MYREQENSHLGWPDHTHGIAGVSDWGKTKLKTRCWMGWVLIWRHWWKTHLQALLSCWQNSVFCGCRTEVSACVCVYVSHSVVSNSATPWTIAYQAPLSMEFSRQEYWSGLLFPSPGDLPKPGIEPRSSALWADAVPSEPPGSGKEPACQCRRGRRGRFNPWDWIFYWTSNKEYWIPERQITLVVKSVGAGILHSWVLVSNLTNHLISISLSLKEEC